MSAQVYSPRAYNRIHHIAPSAPTSRRHPFTNALNHQLSPPKPQDKPKVPPSSPPLPRQNSKTTPPSPPRVISDKSGKLQFQRIGFLGEVSLTRCLSKFSKKSHCACIGWLCSCIRSQRCRWYSTGLQGRHQRLAQDQKG